MTKFDGPLAYAQQRFLFLLIFCLLCHSQIQCCVFHHIRFTIPWEVVLFVTFMVNDNIFFLFFTGERGFRGFILLWNFGGVSKHQVYMLRLRLIRWISWESWRMTKVMMWVVLWVHILVKGRSCKLLVFVVYGMRELVELLTYEG